MAGVTPDIVVSSGKRRILYTTLGNTCRAMRRSEEIDNDLELVREIIKFSPAERVAVIGLLHQRQSHRELAKSEGISRQASKQRMLRARKRARRHGLEIPAPKRPQKRTLSEMRAA
jgi:DNA-directed RNA polymerase specialized sigma24 family protein